MNKGIKKATAKQRISRAKYQCPTELQEMIDLVRLVPFETQMSPLVEMFITKFRQEFEQEKDQNSVTLFDHLFLNRDEVYLERVIRKIFPELSPLSILDEALERTSQEFRDYISIKECVEFENPFSDEEEGFRTFVGENKNKLDETYIFIKMMCAYTDFYQLRISLQLFANHLEIESRFPPPRNRDGRKQNFEMPLNNISVKRKSDGKLHLTGLAKLIAEGFDDSRLRKCRKCQHIFWAKREDSKTCSKRCLNAFNVQKYRKLTEKEKADRKIKRIENRDLVNSGKAKIIKRSK